MNNLYHERVGTAWIGLRPKLYAFLDRAGAKGYRLLVVRVWASWAEQMAIYQKGRAYDSDLNKWLVSDPSAIVTRALPGQSGHNVLTHDNLPAAMCADVIPLDLKGQPLWGLPAETPIQLEQRWIDACEKTEGAAWADLYILAGRCGLDPYGDPVGAYLKTDKGHCEEGAWALMLPALGLHLPEGAA